MEFSVAHSSSLHRNHVELWNLRAPVDHLDASPCLSLTWRWLRWAEGDKNMPGARACSFIGIVRSVWDTTKKWNLCIWESPERYNVCCFLYMLYLPVPAKHLHLSSNLALKALQDVLYPFDKRDRSIGKLHNLLKMMVVVVVTSQEATQGRKSWLWFMDKGRHSPTWWRRTRAWSQIQLVLSKGIRKQRGPVQIQYWLTSYSEGLYLLKVPQPLI